jgi:4-amino-4-deoxy-L-arabinose transferase-like glycosyltransferase
MSRRVGGALLALLVLSAAVRLAYFTGLQVGDDIVYSRITVDRLHGTTHFGNVHQTRSGFLLPLVVSYALFGAGELPLVLYNLACSVGLVAAVFFMGRRVFGDGAGLLAAAVAALHPNLVRFATECHTDTPAALWQALAVAAFLAALESERPRPLLVLAGLLLGWAYLHKEHAVFLVPFFAGHWIVTRRRWTWYLPLALPALAVFAAESAGFALMTGNPFKRFEMIRYWHSGRYMAEQYPTAGAILYRLFLDLPSRLLMPWHGLAALGGLIAGGLLVARRDPGARLLAGWWAAIYLGYSFWPSSIVPFLPAFSLYEWTLPVLQPPLAVLLGGGLSRLRRPAAAAALVSLSALHLVALHLVWLRERSYAAGPREAHEWIERERPARVIADDKTIEALDFFEGHDPRRVYVPFQSAEGLGGAAVIVDRFWTREGSWQCRPVAPEVRRPPASWRKVYESPRVAIYRTY